MTEMTPEKLRECGRTDSRILCQCVVADAAASAWEADRARIEGLKNGLRNVLYQGHDNDCLFCGLKDKIATDALAAIAAKI